jgi:hypothetical protein
MTRYSVLTRYLETKIIGMIKIVLNSEVIMKTNIVLNTATLLSTELMTEYSYNQVINVRIYALKNSVKFNIFYCASYPMIRNLSSIYN